MNPSPPSPSGSSNPSSRPTPWASSSSSPATSSPPPSAGRAEGKFLRDRTVRLGVPALIYMLMINPAILYYVTSLSAPNPTPTPAPTPIGFTSDTSSASNSSAAPGRCGLPSPSISPPSTPRRGSFEVVQEKKDEEAATEGAEGTGDDAASRPQRRHRPRPRHRGRRLLDPPRPADRDGDV